MTTLTTSSLLHVTSEGTIRIASSRVSLDSIVYHHKQGASAQDIARKFPSLDINDIHSAISYFVNHQEEVEGYLRQQEAESLELRKQIESMPEYQNSALLRSRLLERKSTMKR